MMTTTDDSAMLRWIKRFPGYCTFCKGAGGREFTENHGMPGMGERFFEPCDALPETSCHRCGKGNAVDIDPADGQPAPCSYCGWSYGTGADDIMPLPQTRTCNLCGHYSSEGRNHRKCEQREAMLADQPF